MSAKFLRDGTTAMIAAREIALGSSVFPGQNFSSHTSGVLATKTNRPGQLALAEWARLRRPCRRIEWWR